MLGWLHLDTLLLMYPFNCSAWPALACSWPVKGTSKGTDESGSDICSGCRPILAGISVLRPFISYEFDPKANTAGGFMATAGWSLQTCIRNQQHMLSDSTFQPLSSAALAGSLPNNVRTVVFSAV